MLTRPFCLEVLRWFAALSLILKSSTLAAMMRPPRVLMALALLGSGGSALAAKDVYLFELLKQAPYRAAWTEMLKGEAVPGWVASYAKTFNGPASPVTAVTVGGESDTLAWVCKTHDCRDNQLHVLFAPGGSRAWALLSEDSQQRFLGHPTESVQAVLKQAMQQKRGSSSL